MASRPQAYVASLYYVPKLSTILTFVLLFVMGSIMFIALAPENFVPTQVGPPSPGIPDGAEPATVNFVHDGDTLFLTTEDDDNLKVRLLGVDTPEVNDCYADEATTFLRNLAPEGSTVFTVSDAEPVDQYGRALLMIWTPSGQLINLALVGSGHAEAVFIDDNRLYEDEFESAEAAAQKASLGMWGAC